MEIIIILWPMVYLEENWAKLEYISKLKDNQIAPCKISGM